ncbi:efflux RND transporter periplasmic adaptor subunit [Methylomonas sp. SURF-2]|uniref:Efflux RND transporter periplasmic adaptor subunit n=2 Tax=Methylomonas subterranea TaxID=2952225 RepID=A0ABT1TG46_9GAMM|nr:efflux RND transporter periplasmic adaptor subunit [Methylomonas sp. SURF-2]MCQ8103729.1 efflux RND transporter periplasmic adaptor subunit [Methylomonas sp. SURF-2]
MSAFIVGGILILNACREEPETKTSEQSVRPVKVLKIGNVSSDQTLKMPSTVRASDRVDLAFQVPGRLIEMPVKEGQAVKKGDLLARLDPRDYETNLRNATGTLAKAKAKLEYDIAEYHRYVSVKEKEAGAVSDSVLSLKKAAENVSKADLQSAQAGVDAARDQLAYSYLRAPFAGVLAKRYVDNYQEVQAKQTIISLQNTTAIELLIDVPELLVAPERRIPRAHAEFASAPGKLFELTVKEFATQADPMTQTYQVVLVMPSPRGIRILPGMTANVIFDLSDTDVADTEISIPAIAVTADTAGKPFVWVIDDKTMQVQRRSVTTGALTGNDNIRITAGLKPGETIAISGVSMLRDGQVVRAFDNR